VRLCLGEARNAKDRQAMRFIGESWRLSLEEDGWSFGSDPSNGTDSELRLWLDADDLIDAVSNEAEWKALLRLGPISWELKAEGEENDRATDEETILAEACKTLEAGLPPLTDMDLFPLGS
jgi:hypothetical protein